MNNARSRPKPDPAPRLRADARRNRERVLEAARRAFAEEGLGIPLDEIARRAGVGPGTVHRHFPTKESLFEGVLLGTIERLTTQARSLARAPEPGDAFFSFLAELLAEAATSRALVEALERVSTDVKTTIGEAGRILDSALGTLFSRAQKAGTVRNDLSGDDLHALVKGALSMQQAGSPASRERLVAVLFDGLRAKPDLPPATSSRR